MAHLSNHVHDSTAQTRRVQRQLRRTAETIARTDVHIGTSLERVLESESRLKDPERKNV
jgi:hypothetical protein